MMDPDDETKENRYKYSWNFGAGFQGADEVADYFHVIDTSYLDKDGKK